MSTPRNNFNNDYLPELSKSSFIIDYEHYKIDGDNELTLAQYLNEVSLPISNLINKKKKETYNFKIQLSVGINFNFAEGIDEICTLYVRSDAKKLDSDKDKDSDTTKITNNLTNSILNNYYEMLSDNPNLGFDTIFESSIHANIINYKCHCNNLK